MNFDWQKVIESKKAYRRKLAALPIAEKLRLVDELNQRALMIRGARLLQQSEPTTPLEPFEEHVRQRFAEWLEQKRVAGITFNSDQFAWLEKIRDYISASGSVDREHLEADNVLGPIYKAFGEKLWPLMEELNLTLAA